MEDAYVIGIRLVLENGVSAGVAAIGRDLAAFDRALAATTGNVQSLRDLGAGLTPSAATARREPEPVPQPGTPEPFLAIPEPRVSAYRNSEPPPANISRSPLRGAAAAPFQTGDHIVQRTAVPADAHTKVIQPSPAVAGSSATGGGNTAQVQALLPSAAPIPRLAATAPTIVPAMVPRPEPIAPKLDPVGSSMMRYADFAPTRLGPNVLADMPSAVGREGTFVPNGPQPIGSSQIPTLEAEAEPVEAIPSRVVTMTYHQTALRGHSAESATQGPAAPTQGDAANGRETPSRLAQGLTTPLSAAAPTASPASSGPIQGDVYLDGTRMGRWLADRLGREADRPPSGMTGFDSRLGITWPGSMHGT
jgi:hypothetical protein